MTVSAPRLLVSLTESGVGKTTFTLGLLACLRQRGLVVQAAKGGPDYIDPMFHERVLGRPSRNLDLFLSDTNLVRHLLADGAQHADVTIIEGAMGHYDGIAWTEHASSHELACVTGTPAVLLVDARRRALSMVAEISGYLRFRRPQTIRAVVLNRATEAGYRLLKDVIERECAIPVCGYVPTLEGATLASRHLGLVTPDAVGDLASIVDDIARSLERTVDVRRLLEVAQGAPPLPTCDWALPTPCPTAPLVAVARDRAFSFLYHDTLELLRRLGARLAFFSPLADQGLPHGCSGLILCGGYPELFAAELAANESLRKDVRTAVRGGMPTIAECGGFLYLQQTLDGADGMTYPMAGALEGHAYDAARLVRFGYAELTAKTSGLLREAGGRLRAHEFHHWDTDRPGDAFLAKKPHRNTSWECVVSTRSLHAGFPHLYLPGAPEAAARFVRAAADFAARRRLT